MNPGNMPAEARRRLSRGLALQPATIACASLAIHTTMPRYGIAIHGNAHPEHVAPSQSVKPARMRLHRFADKASRFARG